MILVGETFKKIMFKGRKKKRFNSSRKAPYPKTNLNPNRSSWGKKKKGLHWQQRDQWKCEISSASANLNEILSLHPFLSLSKCTISKLTAIFLQDVTISIYGHKVSVKCMLASLTNIVNYVRSAQNKHSMIPKFMIPITFQCHAI